MKMETRGESWMRQEVRLIKPTKVGGTFNAWKLVGNCFAKIKHLFSQIYMETWNQLAN